MTTAARGHVVTAFADMFDQVWWTKLPAHAGPIGRLANRCLGAVYFGVTTVHIALDTAPGLTLGLHLSAHKPATPLHDAIEHLAADEERLRWLQSVHHFVVDRGGNGKRTLRFMHDARLPYLTMAQRSTELPAVAEATDFTESGLPLQVTPDLALAGDVAPNVGEPGPRRVVFPANPDRGTACETAIGAAEIALYLEPIHEYRDREHQRELVRVFDEAALTLTGRTLRLRLRKPRATA